MLRTALGPAIATFLEDPSIVEVMLNPDGQHRDLYRIGGADLAREVIGDPPGQARPGDRQRTVTDAPRPALPRD